MKSLSENGKYQVSEKILANLREQFDAGYTDEEQTLATIKKYYEEYGYVVDPHTAVALNVYERKNSEYKSVILSTASPYKFPASVCKAISDVDIVDEWKLFETVRVKSSLPVPSALNGLKDKAERFDGVCNADEMVNAIKVFLKI